MLRLILPPNLPAAAARDAIAVPVELGEIGPEPAPEELPALARLQSRGRSGAPDRGTWRA